MNAIREPHPTPVRATAPASEAAVLSKAAVRAAAAARAHAARRRRQRSASRRRRLRACSPASTCSSPDHAKEWELARLFVRMFRSLDALWGHEEIGAHVARERQPGAGGPPAGPAAFGRRDGPCRRVPGRRARSRLSAAPLRRRRLARGRGAARRRRRWRWSTRSTSSTCSSACSTRASRRCPRRARACTTCCSRRFAMRRRRAARAFADPPTRACSTARTRSAPRAPNSATGAGGTCSTCRHCTRCRRGRRRCSASGSRRARVDLREAAVRARSRDVDAPDDYSGCQRFGATRARAGMRRHPLRIGARPAAWRMLRRADAARVRATVAARAADVDAVGLARARRAGSARTRWPARNTSFPRSQWSAPT